jgi:hypothetical protein
MTTSIPTKGEILYRTLQTRLINYTNNLLANSLLKSGPDVLSFYMSEWNKFRISSTHISNRMNYLNRHFVQRLQDDKTKSEYDTTIGAYSAKVYSYVIWKKHFLDETWDSLLSGAWKAAVVTDTSVSPNFNDALSLYSALQSLDEVMEKEVYTLSRAAERFIQSLISTAERGFGYTSVMAESISSYIDKVNLSFQEFNFKPNKKRSDRKAARNRSSCGRNTAWCFVG